MKKNCFVFCFSMFVVFFTGCATTMKMTKFVDLSVPESLSQKTEPNMEFIGFKADANILLTGNGDSVKLSGTWSAENHSFPSEFDLWKTYRNDTCLKNIGSVLQSANIAYDQSYAYFGIYSLQELELYKSQKRFVTFIEVNKHRLGGTVKDNFLLPSSAVTGAGLGLVSVGALWAGLDTDNELGLGDTGKSLIGFGDLFPDPIPDVPASSPWQSVANSFFQVSNIFGKILNEQTNSVNSTDKKSPASSRRNN